jgi:molybdopterin molybdotransferase
MTASRQTPQRINRLAPLAEVLARIDAIACPVSPREIEITAAAARVLAADAAVPAAVPPASIALRDGWAVQSDLVSDAGPYAPQALEPAPLWVEAGSPLPPNTDAIVPPDTVTLSGGAAQCIATATPGEGVLAAGADAEQSHALFHAGERLRAIDLAILRAAGVPRVTVREPCLRLVCANPMIDAIDDWVAPLLARAIEAGGGVAEIRRVELEGTSSLERALLEDGADAILVIGGTGAGRHDGSVAALARVGNLEIHGIGLVPGDTTAVGIAAARPVLIVPGRLDAALSAWLVLGRRLLARLSGFAAAESGAKMTVTRKIVSTVGLAEVVPVRRCDGGVEPVAAGFFPLRAMARAHGYVLVVAESEGVPAGAVVEVLALP